MMSVNGIEPRVTIDVQYVDSLFSTLQMLNCVSLAVYIAVKIFLESYESMFLFLKTVFTALSSLV